MKIAIVGYGVEGQSALPYWLAQGADVTVCDKNENTSVPAGVKVRLGADYLKNLDEFDVIVRTVGMHPKIILEQNPGVQGKITTNIDEFLRVCPTKNVIGVTGTKGKGTTSMLITKMLEAMGKQAFLGGNYGTPAFSFLPQLTEDSWVVMELSSFMLYDLKRSPRLAVCLMIAPEHLDWHSDEEDYYQAKANLFKYQSPQDTAMYFADNLLSHKIASASPGKKIPYYAEPGAYVQNGNIVIDQTVLCATKDIQLPGEHNWQNACAAATAVWQVGQDADAIRKVLTTFTGLPHRLEFVREVDRVKYFDDSFGTTPETAEVAVKSFDVPKILILGGSDKGVPFDALARTVAASNVRAVVTIGQMAGKITEALQNAGFNKVVPGGNTMQEIVGTCQAQAKKGDVVLLSPACASFDMFKDYKDRAAQFTAAVQAL